MTEAALHPVPPLADLTDLAERSDAPTDEHPYPPGTLLEQSSLFAPITGASYAEIRLATAIRTAGWIAIVRELGHLHASEGDSPTYQRTRDVLQTFFNEQTTARWWIKHRSWFLPPDALI